MKALNTEILLDYLVEGNEKSEHTDLFFNSVSETEIYFLNNIVLHEVATSFEENVKFDKSDILTALHALIANSQIRFENREMVTDAIKMYKIGRTSFSECLKMVINRSYQSDDFEPAVKINRMAGVL